nr:hypothetical protein [Tanacetum cinerariifolium]
MTAFIQQALNSFIKHHFRKVRENGHTVVQRCSLLFNRYRIHHKCWVDGLRWGSCAGNYDAKQKVICCRVPPKKKALVGCNAPLRKEDVMS